jgi:hypothetical protein
VTHTGGTIYRRKFFAKKLRRYGHIRRSCPLLCTGGYIAGIFSRKFFGDIAPPVLYFNLIYVAKGCTLSFELIATLPKYYQNISYSQISNDGMSNYVSITYTRVATCDSQEGEVNLLSFALRVNQACKRERSPTVGCSPFPFPFCESVPLSPRSLWTFFAGFCTAGFFTTKNQFLKLKTFIFF